LGKGFPSQIKTQGRGKFDRKKGKRGVAREVRGLNRQSNFLVYLGNRLFPRIAQKKFEKGGKKNRGQSVTQSWAKYKGNYMAISKPKRERIT